MVLGGTPRGWGGGPCSERCPARVAQGLKPPQGLGSSEPGQLNDPALLGCPLFDFGGLGGGGARRTEEVLCDVFPPCGHLGKQPRS